MGMDFSIKHMILHDQSVRLQVWDASGRERYHTLTEAYLRGVHGVLLVYDLTDAETFERLGAWLDRIQRHARKDVNKVLIANKCDLIDRRAVLEEDGERLAASCGIPYVETSAKDNINVQRAFNGIITEASDRILAHDHRAKLEERRRRRDMEKDSTPQRPSDTSRTSDWIRRWFRG